MSRIIAGRFKSEIMIEPEMRGLQSRTKNMNYRLKKGFRAHNQK
jgi:hypothetical protein